MERKNSINKKMVKALNFTELEKTVFVDDVLSYLNYAEECGVTAYHISSFID